MPLRARIKAKKMKSDNFTYATTIFEKLNSFFIAPKLVRILGAPILFSTSVDNYLQKLFISDILNLQNHNFHS